MFDTLYQSVLSKLSNINPEEYGRTRNFIDGSVTRLSPYISRGVLSTKQILHYLYQNGYGLHNAEKLIQELAWRDYWQQVWVHKGDEINNDLKSAQTNVNNHGLPNAILEASTGIVAIDKAIHEFYSTGYLHNHVRMYIASITCNIAKCHWKLPAQWMYYNLLDGDWASNALSWQWVCGTNSNKKYYANQENINKYCHTNQSNTFLDIPYSKFEEIEVPGSMENTTSVLLTTILPDNTNIHINKKLPTLIYNYYNLDPLWKSNASCNRILLLEPSLFAKYPISENCIHFMMALAKNMDGIQIFTGEFQELITQHSIENIHFKEHPLNTHYSGSETERDWMFNVKGYYPSFFAFWKQCKKELKSKSNN